MKILIVVSVAMALALGFVTPTWVFADCDCPKLCTSFAHDSGPGGTTVTFQNEAKIGSLHSINCVNESGATVTIAVPNSGVTYQSTVDCNASSGVVSDNPDRDVTYKRTLDYRTTPPNDDATKDLEFIWQPTFDAEYSGWRHLCCGVGSTGAALVVETFAHISYTAPCTVSNDEDPDVGWRSLGQFSMVLKATGDCTIATGSRNPSAITFGTVITRDCLKECKKDHVQITELRYAVTNPSLRVDGSAAMAIVQTADVATCAEIP